jgi:hypothetical protein
VVGCVRELWPASEGARVRSRRRGAEEGGVSEGRGAFAGELAGRLPALDLII